QAVRDALAPRTGRPCWLPASTPVWLTERTVMVGVDGWGDARCGNLESKVQLSDWQLIEDFKASRYDRPARIQLLQDLGDIEAAALRETLAEIPESDEMLVLTHVPPFPEACWYNGEQSEPAWLPWFTCVATGEVLAEHAAQNPNTRITVLCGHTHGAGSYEAMPNLVVRTGGWPPNVEGYGNPIVQTTLEL
ncbi:MAG TPA: phosphoesterase, partial [Kofleriaceae bacterium]|nr:phosphoesterase [Kofleriaceae bacterium]